MIKVQVQTHLLPGFSPGQVVSVPTDEHGTPLEAGWRRILRQAGADHSVEVLEPDASPAPPEERAAPADQETYE